MERNTFKIRCNEQDRMIWHEVPDQLIKDEIALCALLVHVRIFKLKVLFSYFTCNLRRVGPSFDHDGTAIKPIAMYMQWLATKLSTESM